MFTPGPWEWVEDTWNGGYSGIVGKDNQEVLYPSHCNDGDDGAAWFDEFPSEADHNLIASAPEMYEALKAYEEWEAWLLTDDLAWDGESLPRFTQRLYDKWMETQAKRNAALSKAEGRDGREGE